MIEDNVRRILAGISDAAVHAGRKPEEITLCAVTKTVDAQKAQEVLNCGVHVLGENRVQSLTDKYNVLGSAAEWHLIGHLQTNKVKYVMDKVSLIHSVDSLHLAEEIQRRSAALGKITNILIEVNVSGEASKYGIAPSETEVLLEKLAPFSALCVRGLMTIAPIPEKEGANRQYFAQLRELFERVSTKKYDNCKMDVLSMGMSRDYLDAVKEGATIVRVGTALFAE